LEWLISLTQEEFRDAFRGSAVKRTKWHGLVRNACVALGNSGLRPGEPRYEEIRARLTQLAAADDAIIAEHAQWALTRLGASAKLPQVPTAPVVPRGAQR
jgi:epoxyqueuosine reductase